MIRELGPNDIVYLLEAARWTIALALIAMVAGGVLGLVVAVLRIVAFAPANWLAIGYVNLIQGTPLLGQLFVFFFGLPLFGFLGFMAAFFNSIWIILSIWRAGKDYQ